jgi:NADP-reducing hydrogenase subunit HndD
VERQQALYDVDERSIIRRSHENPAVQAIYAQFLTEPNSLLAHKLLHTHYVAGAPPAVQKAGEQIHEQA